ncbi:MAG: hypothetical protein JO253_03260 [Alphaproteobacteria bacterium]|nr:hypothetical protein [Alphaproteobacteria bacterium]
MDGLKPLLPHSWAAKIFERLTATYGREFEGKFKSGELIDTPAGKLDKGIALAMQAWREELGGFVDMGEDGKQTDKNGSIAYALANLPESAPNLIEFRNMCRNAPAPVFKAIPHKLTEQQREANQVRIREIAGGIGQAFHRRTSRVSPHWAKTAENFELWPYITHKYCLEAYAYVGEVPPLRFLLFAMGNSLKRYLTDDAIAHAEAAHG